MKNGLSKFFDIDGKLGRVGFLMRSIILYVLIAIIYFVNNVIMAVLIELDRNHHNIKTGWLTPYTVIMTTILIIIVSSAIIIQIERLNDLNKKRYLTILTFIPPLNIVFFLYLIIAKGKQSGNRYAYGVMKNKDMDDGDKKNGEQQVNKNSNTIKRLIILLTVLLIIATGYFTLFHTPYNGEWETEISNRLILLQIYNGEGRLIIYPKLVRSDIPVDVYKVIIREKVKKNTTIGIDGKSHKMDLKANILMIELNNLNTEVGNLNREIYLKKLEKKRKQ